MVNYPHDLRLSEGALQPPPPPKIVILRVNKTTQRLTVESNRLCKLPSFIFRHVVPFCIGGEGRRFVDGRCE